MYDEKFQVLRTPTRSLLYSVAKRALQRQNMISRIKRSTLRTGGDATRVQSTINESSLAPATLLEARGSVTVEGNR